MNIFTHPVYAVEPVANDLGSLCGEGLGPFAKFLCELAPATDAPGNKDNATRAVASFAFLISNIVGIMTVVGGLWFIFQFVLAGYKWMSAGGDKGKLQEAQSQIMHALIGLIIVVSAFALISLVSSVLGVDLLLTNPKKFVEIFFPVPE